MATTYTPVERRLHDEAVRAIPGILAAKERGDREGARVLCRGVLVLAHEIGIHDHDIAWSILFNACLQWFMQAMYVVAHERELTFEEVMEEALVAASLWEPDAA